MERSRQRFLWQTGLVVLPMLGLAAFALWSLRHDQARVETRYREEAERWLSQMRFVLMTEWIGLCEDLAVSGHFALIVYPNKDTATANSYVINNENKSRAHFWNGKNAMKKERPYVAVALRAIAEGPTEGSIKLHLPNGETKTVYRWTGNESEFRKTGKIRTNEDVRWFYVDIRNHSEDLPGDYKVTFDHESGEGGLRVFEVRLNYNR